VLGPVSVLVVHLAGGQPAIIYISCGSSRAGCGALDGNDTAVETCHIWGGPMTSCPVFDDGTVDHHKCSLVAE
jgi:hypothetical protein